MQAKGQSVMPSVEQLSADLKNEMARWAKVVQQAGIKVD